MIASFLQRQPVFFLAFLFSFIPQRQLVFFADSLLSRLNDRFLSIIPSGLLSCFLERLQSCNLVFKFSKPLSFRPLSVTYFHLSILLSFLKSGTNKRRKTTPFEMCPQMSPFVLICPITRYFTAFLIPVTLQPKGIGQANQAPGVGSVPISANSNPSVGGFLFALANSKVCSKQLEILSAALNALPGRSRDRVTPKS